MEDTIDDTVGEFNQQYLCDHKIYALPERLAYRAGFDSRAAVADTIGKITSSLAIGTPLDYFAANLRGWGIIASRGSATAINTVTGGPYGKWQEGWYRFTRTKPESNVLRKWFVEMGAFNTFETYVYAIGIIAGQWAEKGSINLDIDWWNVSSGMEALIKISWAVAPFMGAWMAGTRRLFGVESAVQAAIKP